jgi:predicted neutral ceramidase superfamily lipid hydrolase
MFYFFRRSISIGKNGMGWWALLLGCAAVFIRYLTGPLVAPVGFGLSLWMSGFIDIVSLPVLVPIIVCVILAALRFFPSDVDIGGFTFLWLVPLTFYNSADRSLLYSPLMLVLVPLLWTVQTLGISFFIGCVNKYPRWYIIIPSILAAAALPLTASSSWWAFYSQQTPTGCLFLFVSIMPALISLIAEWRANGGSSRELPENY